MSNLSNSNPSVENSSGNVASLGTESPRCRQPHYRIQQLEAGLQAVVEVPGVRKSDVELTVEEGILEVNARREASLDSRWTPLAGHREDALVYRLRLALDDSIDVDKIAAMVDDGVLRLDFPLREEKQARRIEVN